MFQQLYLHLKISTKMSHWSPPMGDVRDNRVGPMGHEQSVIVSGN